MKIFTIAEVPDELGQEWLQWLRDFDVAHPGCHFNVLSLTELITEDMVKMLQGVDPPIPIVDVVQKRRH